MTLRDSDSTNSHGHKRQPLSSTRTVEALAEAERFSSYAVMRWRSQKPLASALRAGEVALASGRAGAASDLSANLLDALIA